MVARKRFKVLYRCFEDTQPDQVDKTRYPNLTVKLDAASKIKDSFMELIKKNKDSRQHSYKLMFEKYPIDNEQNRYVQIETNKPQNVLKEFSTCVSTFTEFNIENLIRSKKNKMINYQLGEWIIQLLCLIPIQIAVSKNHKFQPLCDGTLKAESEQSDGCHITRNISFGWYEGILNHLGNFLRWFGNARHLMNHDTGERIDDPIVNFSEILHDFNESVEVFPDFDVKLYDEHEPFGRLSEDLKRYFENNIQSRKDFSDDNWFFNFDIFIKYIIKRRVSRVQDWFTQNISKFPQNHSEIVNGKYAMEQETSKLTLLWSLCGLKCQQCDLKCVKNLDHKEQHDCLTDHKCHSFCQFVEAHNNKLVPKCMYKVEHEGKHVCDKVKHSCGKPCDLADKGNCLLVCSKEIGHGGKHLCQSSRHYC
ncbi:2572_t:CDS:2, partial [Funneliformis geosporum]